MQITKDKTQIVLTRLSLGIIQYENAISPESRPLSILNPHVQQAWEYLSLCACINHLPIPTQITDFISLLHQPVEEWSIIGDHCQSLGYSGSVLNAQGLSPQFRALAEQIENTYKPHLELEDQLFKDILEKCRQGDDANSYAGIRTFLLFHPIYDDIYLIDNPTWESNLTSNLEVCYEHIPKACILGTKENPYIVTCPHCGWTLIWRRDGSAHCHEDGVCAEEYTLTDYADDEDHQIPYHPDMVRTKEGIQRYVVAPEIALKQIYDALQREWNIQCDLFPNFDSYDLLVKLPNGDHWAVDVKDWRNAVSLAIGVSKTPFRYLPQWDNAFYIFPTYRAKQAYLNEFSNYWVSQKDVTFMSQHKFLEMVRAVAR